MELSVIYFAAVRELVGLDSETIRMGHDAPTVSTVINELLSLHPKLIMEGVRVAVNEEFAADDLVVQDGDTIALIPPVSGG